MKKSAYENCLLKPISAAAGLVPAVGPYAGPGIGILGSVLENDFIGKPPSGPPPPTSYPLPDMSIGTADREILNALIAFGQNADVVPPQYLIQGHVATPGELARVPGITSGTYDHAVSEALVQVLRQIYGNDPDRPVIPDQHMIDRYNAVIIAPDPEKHRHDHKK